MHISNQLQKESMLLLLCVSKNPKAHLILFTVANLLPTGITVTDEQSQTIANGLLWAHRWLLLHCSPSSSKNHNPWLSITSKPRIMVCRVPKNPTMFRQGLLLTNRVWLVCRETNYDSQVRCRNKAGIVVCSRGRGTSTKFYGLPWCAAGPL